MSEPEHKTVTVVREDKPVEYTTVQIVRDLTELERLGRATLRFGFIANIWQERTGTFEGGPWTINDMKSRTEYTLDELVPVRSDATEDAIDAACRENRWMADCVPCVLGGIHRDFGRAYIPEISR